MRHGRGHLLAHSTRRLQEAHPKHDSQFIRLHQRLDSRTGLPALSQSPTDPDLPNLNSRIQHDISETNKQTCIHRTESCSHKYNVTQLFSLIRQLNSTHPQAFTPNQPITFKTKTLTSNLDTACAFNHQFTYVVYHTTDPEARRVNRRHD